MMKIRYVLAVLGLVCAVQANQILHYDSITPRLQMGGYYVGQSNMTATDIEGVEDGQFATFCVELSEEIYLGRDYYVVVNTETAGAGGADPLSPSTAWLYNEFLSGAISVQDAQDAVDLQMAMWMLEDEPITSYFSQSDITQRAKDWRDDALNCGWDDISNIRVLNVTEGNITRQDVLVKTDEYIPEPATAGLLGLAGLMLLRRRK